MFSAAVVTAFLCPDVPLFLKQAAHPLASTVSEHTFEGQKELELGWAHALFQALCQVLGITSVAGVTAVSHLELELALLTPQIPVSTH